jgi:hypothetical protein
MPKREGYEMKVKEALRLMLELVKHPKLIPTVIKLAYLKRKMSRQAVKKTQ